MHSEVDEAELAARFHAMLQAGRREIEAEGLRGAPRERLGLSMRYAQQNYEQDVEYRFADGLPAACERFHRRHEEFFGYQFPDHPVELVHLKVSVAESAAEPPRPAGAGYRRDRLPAGTDVRGPAVIEELDSTTFVPDGVQLAVDRLGNLVLTLPAAAPEEA